MCSYLLLANYPRILDKIRTPILLVLHSQLERVPTKTKMATRLSYQVATIGSPLIVAMHS